MWGEQGCWYQINDVCNEKGYSTEMVQPTGTECGRSDIAGAAASAPKE
jgi:hypothetical protein